MPVFEKLTVAMLYSVVSRILADDFGWPQDAAWGILLCAILATSTYILRSRWTPSIQPQRYNESANVVEPKGGVSRNKCGNISEVGAIISDDKDQNVPNPITTLENTRKPESDGATSRRPALNAPKRNLPPADYTVGRICAIGTEYITAQTLLN